MLYGVQFYWQKKKHHLVNKCDLKYSKDFAWSSAGRASSISTAKAFITWDSGFKNTDARSELAVLSSVLLSFVPFVSKSKLYTPSTLNIDLILWHTQLNVCA